MQHPVNYSQIADLYDVLVRFEDDIPFFLTEARQAAGSVLDLMCGTGRVSLPLIAAGVPVTCVDRSPDMLDVLRSNLARRRLEAQVVEADVRTLPFGRRFSLAILPFNSFSELVTEADQRAALASIGACVQPGGRFICTLHNPAVRLRGMDSTWKDRARVPNPHGGGDVVLRVRESFDATTRIVSGIQAFVTVGHEETESRREMGFQFSALERDSFEDLAEAAGFRVLAFYGDYSRSVFVPDESPFMIWVVSRE